MRRKDGGYGEWAGCLAVSLLLFVLFPFPHKTYLLGAAVRIQTLLPSSSFLQGTSPSCTTRSRGTVSESRGCYPSPPNFPLASSACSSILGWLPLHSPTSGSPCIGVAACIHVAPSPCVSVCRVFLWFWYVCVFVELNSEGFTR